MKYPNQYPPRRGWWLVLLPAAAALAGAAPPLGAQTCPTQTVTITRPANGVINLCGTMRLDISLTAPPAGWNQGAVTCSIYSGSTLVEQGLCYVISSTQVCYKCDSTLHPNGSYTAKATTSLYNPVTMQTCPQTSANTPGFGVQNPGVTRTISVQKLQRAFVRNRSPRPRSPTR